MTVGFVYHESGVDMNPYLDKFVNTHAAKHGRGALLSVTLGEKSGDG